MLDYHDLVGGPTVRETAGPLPETPNAADGPVDVAVRVLRGSRMTTRDALFDEFAAALQFPSYFGGNLDALDECLRDLECPEGPTAPVVLAVTEPEALLSEAADDRVRLLRVLESANAVRERRGSGRIALLMVAGSADDAWWRERDGRG